MGALDTRTEADVVAEVLRLDEFFNDFEARRLGLRASLLLVRDSPALDAVHHRIAGEPTTVRDIYIEMLTNALDDLRSGAPKPADASGIDE